MALGCFRMFQGNSKIAEGRLVGSAFPFHGAYTGHLSTIKWGREYNLTKFYFVYGFKHVSNIIFDLFNPTLDEAQCMTRPDHILYRSYSGFVQQTEWWEWLLLMVIVWPRREGPLQISVSISIESSKVVCWSIQKGGDWGSQPISFCSRAANGLQRKV